MSSVIDLTNMDTNEEEHNNITDLSRVDEGENEAYVPPNPRSLVATNELTLTKFMSSEVGNGLVSTSTSRSVCNDDINIYKHPFIELLEKPHLPDFASAKMNGELPLMQTRAAVGNGTVMIQRSVLEQASSPSNSFQLSEPLVLALPGQEPNSREEGSHSYHTTTGAASNEPLHDNANVVECLEARDFGMLGATTQKGQREKITNLTSTRHSAGTSTPTSAQFDTPGGCRNFWRGGDDVAQQTTTTLLQGGMDHVRVHPKFLHSNATSHKWALGAIAELLDNAVDEVPNGATYVNIYTTTNARDKGTALVIKDDGGGMSPETMRQCMSLGFSAKNTATAIGKYGNGFKTSTMRLGADVIVFSSCADCKGITATWSIGLLSYTFLRQMGMEDVVVPMIDYRVTLEGRSNGNPPEPIIRSTLEDWLKNLEAVKQWSPFATEKEIFEVLFDIGEHGTKVLIYNLWMNDDGELELDFQTDEKDIQLRRTEESGKRNSNDELLDNHISNQYHHSLRKYSSILYLRKPLNFEIILRGEPVPHHAITSDLKVSRKVVYKPRIGSGNGAKDVSVDIDIGFTKEAPFINVHGFSVYHKNRLIKPFWKVLHDNSSRGRGVMGVLEANYIEPAHDKQDFERTVSFQRLEAQLRKETLKYWNSNCQSIGYQGGRSKLEEKEGSVEFPLQVSSIASAQIGSAILATKDTKDTDPTSPRYTQASERIPNRVQGHKRQRIDDTNSEQGDQGPSMEAEIGMVNEDSSVWQQDEESTDKVMLDLREEIRRLRVRCSVYETELQAKENQLRIMTSRMSDLEKESKRRK